MNVESVLIGVGILLVSLVFVWRYQRRRHDQAMENAAKYAELKANDLHIPPTLHPVIDPDLCISCLTCVKVCPEGEILGVIGGSVRLIDGSECIGHSMCAIECPVGAIKLVFGTAERGIELPEVNSTFESSRPGVFIIGELGGMGLIKNAMRQGVQLAETMKRKLAHEKKEGTDVVIVGAGPAGLSAAAGLQLAGLSHVIVDQDELGGTVAHYPRHKIVMSETVQVPGYGKFGSNLMSKEDLVECFEDLTKKMEVKVREKVRVEGIDGTPGNFIVKTTAGPIQGRRVVLATGRRGTPRRLGVPGEDLPKVAYGFVDPDQYKGTRVLVVGGGDSALEAACTIADETDASVTISYRRDAFGRCRPANKKRIEELTQSKRIVALMGSEVTRVEAKAVLMKMGGREGALKNDYIIAAIGGELPTEFLKKTGIKVRRFTGQEAGVGPVGSHDQDKGSAMLAWSLFMIGVVIIAAMAFVGGDYYLLPMKERIHHPYHESLKPSGTWGHGVGILATAFMMLNFLYAVRKRTRLLRRLGVLRNWLTFHTFVGFMAPLAIAFHAAFQSRNLLATVTSASLGVVVLTGIIGRYLWSLVPTAKGRLVDEADLKMRLQSRNSDVHELDDLVQKKGPVHGLIAWASKETQESFIGHVVRLPGRYLQAWVKLRAAQSKFPDPNRYEDFRDDIYNLLKLNTQLNFYRSLKRLMAVWRGLHVVLAVVMVFVIAAHVGVSLYLGFTWIFR